MSLRLRISLSIMALLAAVFLVTAPVARWLMNQSVADLEDHELTHESQMLSLALATHLQELASTSEAWGAWDDAFRYVTEPSSRPAFEKTAFNPETVRPVGVDLLVYFDGQGNVIRGVALNRGADQQTAIPAATATLVKTYPGVFENTSPETRTMGCIMIGDRPFLFAVQPVTTNSFEGSAGFILAGRIIDSRLAEDLAGRTSMEVGILDSDDYPDGLDSRGAPAVAPPGLLSAGTLRSDDTMTSLLEVADFDGETAAVFTLRHSRHMFELARSWWIVMIIGLAGLLAFVGVATYVTLQKLVLGRVTALARDVAVIGGRDEHGPGAQSGRKDEVTFLAGAIDRMRQRIDTANRDLSATVEELEDITHRRDRLFVNMSHELRTPLNSIIGFSGLLVTGAAGELNPEQLTQVGMVNRSGKHLLRLINDVLDLSRLRAVGMSVDSAEVPLGPIVTEVADMVRPLVDAEQVTLVTDVPERDLIVHTDRGRLLQVLLNLASNSAKFTQRGSVTLRIAAAEGLANISVEDTGCGIEPADLARVMDEFARVEMGGESTVPGTGLGLAISREIVERLGGNLEIRSVVGQGTTFKFSLALSPSV